MTTVCENCMASISPGHWGKVLKQGVESSRHLLKGELDLGDSGWDGCFGIKRVPTKRMESLRIPSQIPQCLEKRSKEHKNTLTMWARLTVQKSKSHGGQHVCPIIQEGYIARQDRDLHTSLYKCIYMYRASA